MNDLLNDENYKRYYCSSELEAKLVDYDKNIAKHNVSDRELKVEVVKNGVIYPHMGVTDENGNFIELSRHKKCIFGTTKIKNRNKNTAIYKKLNNIKYVDEEVIFISEYSTEYMHIILETMSRMWYFVENINKKYKIICNKPLDRIYPVFFEILEILNIPKETLIYIIDKPIKFKKVIVPEQSYIIYGNITHKYKNFIEKLKENIEPTNYKKVYFSRNQIDPATNRTLSEAPIEKVFKDNGFHIVYPEQLSLREKISILKGCEVFAGVLGSNSNHALFLNDNCRAIVLLRSEWPHVVNSELDILRNLRTTYVEAFHQILPVNYNVGPFILGNNQHNSLFNFFDDYGFEYDRKNFDVKFSELVQYICLWSSTHSVHKNTPIEATINLWDLINTINNLLIHYDEPNAANNKIYHIKNSEKLLKMKLEIKNNDNVWKNFILFGVSKSDKYTKIYIFGIALTFAKKNK